MDYAYWAQQEQQEKKQKRIEELLNRLKNVRTKVYHPNTHFPMGGQEEWHIEADSILCELLDELGYHDFVEAFEEVPKWYA